MKKRTSKRDQNHRHSKEKAVIPYVILPEIILPGDSAPISMPVGYRADILKKKAETGEPIFLCREDGPNDEKNLSMRAVGTLAEVALTGERDGSVYFKVFATTRARVKGGAAKTGTTDNFEIEVELHPYKKLAKESEDVKIKARAERLSDMFLEYFALMDDQSADLSGERMMASKTPIEIVTLAETSLGKMKTLPNSKLQEILERDTLSERISALEEIISEELKVQYARAELDKHVSTRMAKEQKLYFLRTQADVIQKQRKVLGDPEVESEDDLTELEEKLKKAKLPDDTRQRVEKELSRVKRANPSAGESSVGIKYLEEMADMPWGISHDINLDLQKVEESLNEEHYGMKEAKEIILESIAVHKSNPQARGKILCFVGSPGVGKTSLAVAVSKALQLPFHRISMGGIQEEAEIRGHRRTFVGALPGQIVTGLKVARCLNPVMILDEIDKMGSSQRGNPADAMLEVLDPKQNTGFRDHFLAENFDLSNVWFIATANNLENMHPALLDRMEIVYIDSYTAEEKLDMARKKLLPRQMKEMNLTKEKISISDDTLRNIIRHYTREMGVRKLEEQIQKLCRKINLKILKGEETPVSVTPENLTQFLGEHQVTYKTIKSQDQVGVMTGLYYSDVGGGILNIEATITKEGEGKFTSSGNLQGSMKESIEYIQHFIKTNADEFNIDLKDLKTKNIHAHFPAAATPKDGPSAGAATAVALLSMISGRKIFRDVAMTGELSTKGEILAIGGLKQKFEGAISAGIRKVLIPKENHKDLAEIPTSIKNNLEIVEVERFEEVLPHVFAEAAQTVRAESQVIAGRIGKKYQRGEAPVMPPLGREIPAAQPVLQ
jgi:ATP-dependent Lon protease